MQNILITPQSFFIPLKGKKMKKRKKSQVWWLMPLIPAPSYTGSIGRRMAIGGQPWAKTMKPCLKNN
jgi:hypothetical protein